MDFNYRKNVVLGITGSVASLKVAQLYLELRKFAHVRIVITPSAKHFFDRSCNYQSKYWQQFIEAGGINNILCDEDEWNLWDRMGDPVLHIELRKWADIILIAPASADFLAKISNGLSDNLLTCTLRAVDVKSTPCIICPAMNTLMWSHSITNEHIQRLQNWGYTIVNPISKVLACKDVGIGALASIDTIISTVQHTLNQLNTDQLHSVQKVDCLGICMSRIKSHRHKKEWEKRLTIGSYILLGVAIGVTITYSIKRQFK